MYSPQQRRLPRFGHSNASTLRAADVLPARSMSDLLGLPKGFLLQLAALRELQLPALQLCSAASSHGDFLGATPVFELTSPTVGCQPATNCSKLGFDLPKQSGCFAMGFNGRHASIDCFCGAHAADASEARRQNISRASARRQSHQFEFAQFERAAGTCSRDFAGREQ